MKRIHIVLILIVFGVQAFAELSMPQLYKQWTIEDINKSNYQKALTEFHQADFTYNADEADMQLDLNKYAAFAQYAFDNHITDAQKIALYKYTADYAYSYADFVLQEKQLTEAKQWFEIAVQYFVPIQDIYPLETTLANNSLGNVLNQLSLYSSAADSYLTALSLTETVVVDTFNLRHIIVNNMIGNYLLLGDTLNAEQYFLTNNPMTEPLDTADIYQFMWKLLADYHYFRGEYKQSLPFFRKTIEYYHTIKNPHEEVNAIWRISYNYLVLQDTTQALQYLKQAYQLAKAVTITDYPFQFTLSTLASLHYKLEDNVQSLAYCKELYSVSLKNPQDGVNFTQDALYGMLLNDIELGKYEDVQNDIQLGADVNSLKWNTSPLHCAMMQDEEKFLDSEIEVTSVRYTDALLKAGAQTDMVGSDIETAIMFEDYRLCHLLLQYGASPKTLIHDNSMTVLQYVESRGLKRFATLLRNPKSYSDKFTIQELHELYLRANHQLDFVAVEQYGEQALTQFYDEIDESKYEGFRTRQQILFYYVSAMVNNVLKLESEYLATRDETILNHAEQKLLKAIGLDTERKKYSDYPDLGFSDLNEILLRLICLRNESLGEYNGVQIYALNELKFREKQGVKDRYYWYTVAQAAHYFKVNSLKEPAREWYRQLLGYMATTDSAIDSIGTTNYVYLIQDMAYLQATLEDTIALRQEFERAKDFFKKQCGSDSSCYYGYLGEMGWHIIPQSELRQYKSRYIATLDKSDIGTITELKIDLLLAECTKERELHDTLSEAVFINEAESILPLLPTTNAICQYSFSNCWILSCFYLAHKLMSGDINIDNTVDNTTIDTTYLQKIWEVVPTYFATNKKRIQDAIATQSYEMAIDWINSINSYYTDQYIYLSINNSEPPSESVAAIYDNELFKKGLLLRNSDNLRRYLTESDDTTAIYLYQKILSLKVEREQYRSQLFSDSVVYELTHEIDDKERILYNLSGWYKEQMQYDNISWTDVRSELKENEVAIEFVNYGYIDQYFALVLRKDYDYPKLVKLPNFKNEPQEKRDNAWKWYLHNLDFALRYQFSAQPEEPHFLEFVGDAGEIYQYGGNGTDLYNALWQPLEEYIHEGETIYFSPVGVLHQLSIEALPISSSEVLADKYDLRRVSSTRKLTQHTSKETITTATLYGGITYDVDVKDRAVCSMYDDGVDRGSVSDLVGTIEEVENISQMLRNRKVKYQIYSADKANEESFKALSGKHQDVLHIATHGFFWPDSVAQSKKYFAGRSTDANRHYIDPLNRCGLYFAGANLALRGNGNLLLEGVQDGILTGKEISLLDLCGTKLVVLSACKTGIGEVTSDGVFGLQRAFKQAGVETIIMSLWEVDDEATQELMTTFYRYWFSGKNKREAFQQAQVELRRTRPDSYYWAGFIMLD